METLSLPEEEVWPHLCCCLNAVNLVQQTPALECTSPDNVLRFLSLLIWPRSDYATRQQIIIHVGHILNAVDCNCSRQAVVCSFTVP